MKNINNYLTKNLCYTVTIFLLTLIATINSFAQVTLPPADRCTSKDLELVEAFLSGSDECVECEEGELLDPQDLNLAILNKTSSLRRAFAFWGTLEVYNSDGTLDESVSLTGCEGPIAKNTTTTLPFNVIETGAPSDYINSSGQIVIKCGQTLKLTGLFLAWTDASPNSVCPLNSALIAPKCGTLPEIEVATGLSATAAVTDITCAGNDGAIDVSVSGGASPYTYDWADISGTSNPADRTGLGPGTYTCTVTDAAGCTDIISETLTAPIPPATPIITIQAATLCATSPPTPTITVCNPVVGATYTVTQPNETAITTPAYVSGALVIGNLKAGKTFEIYATLGECTSGIADCDDVVASCPATSSIAPVNKSSSVNAIKKNVENSERNIFAYPVPFRSKVNVEFKAVRSGKYAINLYDMKGKLIRELNTGNAKAGQLQHIEIDGKNLPDGMYLIRVVDSAGSHTVKLLKKE